MTFNNIIHLPARTPLPASLKQAAACTNVFRIGDQVETLNSINKKTIAGTVCQIQIDPLSGRQWRVLIITGSGHLWRDIAEVKAC